MLLSKLINFIVSVVRRVYVHFDTPPPQVQLVNLRFYTVSNVGQTMAAITHGLWFFVFLFLGVKNLSWIQPVSVIFYVVTINMNRRGHHMISMALSLCEICFHQILAVKMIGYNCGFQYFIPVVAIFPFLISKGNQWMKWLLLVMCVSVYLFIELELKTTVPEYVIDHNYITWLNVSNVTMAFICFATWAIYLTVAVNRSEQIIEKERKISMEAEKAVEQAEIKRALEVKERDNEIYQLRNIELKKSYEDLQAAQMQLIQQEKMASLGQVTAGVAHEINNPINFISGGIVSLKRDVDDVLTVLKKYEEKLSNDEDLQQLKQELDFDFTLSEIPQLIATISDGAQRTSDIVKGLRSFTRLDEMEIKSADINQNLQQTIKLLQPSFGSDIMLNTSFADLPPLQCNSSKLNQAFTNILNNAVQSISGKGEITVSTRTEDEKIWVSIKDSGCGIAPEIKSRIFDPFFTTKDVGKGTGLGLSVAFGIVKEHNGNIWVHSNPGSGSEFVVELPVKQ